MRDNAWGDAVLLKHEGKFERCFIDGLNCIWSIPSENARDVTTAVK